MQGMVCSKTAVNIAATVFKCIKLPTTLNHRYIIYDELAHVAVLNRDTGEDNEVHVVRRLIKACTIIITLLLRKTTSYPWSPLKRVSSIVT